MKREFQGGTPRIVTAVVAVGILFNLLYLSGVLDRVSLALNWRWLLLPSEAFRALHLGLVGTFAFLLYAATRRSAKNGLPWYDLLLIAVGLLSNLYFVVFFEEVVTHFVRGDTTTTEVIFGLLIIGVMMEAGRRVTGIWMPLLALIFFIYPLVGYLLPGLLHIRAHSLDSVVRHVGPSAGGMYGAMTNISARILVSFLFFAALLQLSRANEFMTGVAMGLFGRLTGGPALGAVAASAAFGSIAPSGVANAAATGSVTIPLMMKVGLKPRFAAAVEAVASNGGSIMPPVMASVAFVMADFLGISYWDVAVAAFVPGLLYYAAISINVYLEAQKLGCKGLTRQELPSVRKAMAGGWQFLLPVAVLIYYLGYLKYSPEMSAVYASLALIMVSWFRKDTRLGVTQIWTALFMTGRSIILVAPLFALASVMIAGLDFTGLSLRLSVGLVNLSGGSVLALLILSAIAAIVLGMPLSPPATYLILAVLVAPALGILHVPPIAAHMFLLWFALSGPITPPSCAVCFVTAGIAGEGVGGISVGWTAMRVGAIAYILPFTFVYNPALLLIGNPLGLVVAVVAAIVGVTLLSVGIHGSFPVAFPITMNLWTRTLSIAAGLMFIWPGRLTNSLGLILAIPLVIYLVSRIKSHRQEPHLAA